MLEFSRLEVNIGLFILFINELPQSVADMIFSKSSNSGSYLYLDQAAKIDAQGDSGFF